MSVWQTFLKIQSAARLTVLLQASRALPAQALTAEGRSWPWALEIKSEKSFKCLFTISLKYNETITTRAPKLHF